MHDFRQLKVWQKGHTLTLAVYKASAGLPPEDRYGLTSQLRRACTSIGLNIAESCGKNTDPDRALYVQRAIGSCCEVEYALILCRDLGYLTTEVYEA